MPYSGRGLVDGNGECLRINKFPIRDLYADAVTRLGVIVRRGVDDEPVFGDAEGIIVCVAAARRQAVGQGADAVIGCAECADHGVGYGGFVNVGFGKREAGGCIIAIIDGNGGGFRIAKSPIMDMEADGVT